MAIYLLELLSIAFLRVLTKNIRTRNADKYYCIIAFSIIIVVAGLRKYTIGIDLEGQYARMYTMIGEMSWSDIFQLRYEPGYSIFCKLLSYVSKDPQFYIFITSLICYGSVGLFIYRNSEDVHLSTMIFITCNLMFTYMNVIRQALAVAILLFGINFIKKKQYFQFIAVIILASTFHTSALIALLMVVFSIVGYKRKYVLISFGIYVASLFLGQHFFDMTSTLLGMYEGYATKENYGMAIINSYTVMNSILMLFVFFMANRYIYRENTNSRILNAEFRNYRRKKIVLGDISLISTKKNEKIIPFNEGFMMNMMLLLLIFQSSSMSMAILSRLRIVFHPYLLVIVPQIVERCTNKRIVKKVVYLFLFMYFIYTSTHTSPGNYGTIPYEFFWR